MAMLGGAQWRGRRSVTMIFVNLTFALLLASAERGLKLNREPSGVDEAPGETVPGFLSRAVNFLWRSDGAGYQHVWPVNSDF